MSYQTWIDEFYPTPSHKVPQEQALGHSIQKWTGLKRENLERHQVFITSRGIILSRDESDQSRLEIDADSCALCYHWLDTETNCHGCPLAAYLGKRCDRGGGPYNKFLATKDPAGMLLSLGRAKEYV